MNQLAYWVTILAITVIDHIVHYKIECGKCKRQVEVKAVIGTKFICDCGAFEVVSLIPFFVKKVG